MKKFFLAIASLLMFNAAVANAENIETNQNKNIDMENMLIVELSTGKIVIELYPNKAPKHAARIKELARQGFYDGVTFHRVIAGFMAQTGDPSGTGMGGSDKPNLPAEFNDIKHERGVVSMARASDPNSANSQFFIMLAPATHLDGQYSAFGRVVEGMDYVDAIKKGEGMGGTVAEPRDKIISMKVMADVEKANADASAAVAPTASTAPATVTPTAATGTAGQ